MSDQDKTDEQLDQEQAAALAEQELEGLKARATTLGITFHPSIGADKLRAKISEHLAAQNNPAQPAGMPAAVSAPTSVASAEAEDILVDPALDSMPAAVRAGAIKITENEQTDTIKFELNETPAQRRRRIRNNANELVRINVTCMNPAKKEWAGEIFTVGNNAVGTIKKFVPFNTEDGWHVPRMILQVMQARQCQIFYTEKQKNGVKVRKGKLIKEFGIEILPPLTEEELEELARRQAMASGSSE